MLNLADVFKYAQDYMLIHPLIAPVIFAFLHILFAVCFIPCAPMTVIAGVLWGKGLGLCISIISAFLATCTTFWLSRLLLRAKIYAYLRKKFAKTDWFLEQTRKNGWKFVATVKLNPIAPGSTMGYLFGLTDINFFVYAFFLFIFMLPMQILLVFCGNLLPEIVSGKMALVFLAIMISIIIYLFFGVKGEGKFKG